MPSESGTPHDEHSLFAKGHRFARSFGNSPGIVGIGWMEEETTPVFDGRTEFGTLECGLLRLTMLSARALGIDNGDLQLDSQLGLLRCVAQCWGGHATALLIDKSACGKSLQRNIRRAMWRGYGVKPGGAA